MTLRALVIGAGWAGEGHTIALQAAGVEVVALCARTAEMAQAKAAQLGVPAIRLNWRAALLELQPDIVTIATPARAQPEIVQAAAGQGCHILCEKPFGTSVAAARAMLQAVAQAGVKHAYAATGRYSPALAYARSLLAGGLIGQVREIESILHYNLSPLLPHHWLHQLDEGGGLLNLSFTHKLEEVLYATGASPQVAMGEARRLVDRAPVGPTYHDFRQLFDDSAIIPLEQAIAGEWKEVDADLAYTVLLQLRLPEGYQASAMFQGSLMAMSPQPNHVTFYGTEGSLYLPGENSPTSVQHFDPRRQAWADLPLPPEIVDSFPQVEQTDQRDWNQLAHEFVADIRGEGYCGYPTFREGWRAAEVIDAVRRGEGWRALSAHPPDPDPLLRPGPRAKP